MPSSNGSLLNKLINFDITCQLKTKIGIQEFLQFLKYASKQLSNLEFTRFKG